MPSAVSSSSTVALFRASTVLKRLSNARLRFSPTPAIVSSWEDMELLARSARWCVIAKRCASSRRRCIRCSALRVAVQQDCFVAARQVYLLYALGKAEHGDGTRPARARRVHRAAQMLAAAAVDQHEVGQVAQTCPRLMACPEPAVPLSRGTPRRTRRSMTSCIEAKSFGADHRLDAEVPVLLALRGRRRRCITTIDATESAPCVLEMS